MPNSTIKLDILIVFMQANLKNFTYINLKLQENTELQEIIQYLKLQNKLPFKNCLFTTKPAEKGQFTLQKTIKEVTSQCKLKDGVPVLLCYESQMGNSGQDHGLNQNESIRKTEQLSDQSSAKKSPRENNDKNDKRKDKDCIIY